MSEVTEVLIDNYILPSTLEEVEIVPDALIDLKVDQSNILEPSSSDLTDDDRISEEIVNDIATNELHLNNVPMTESEDTFSPDELNDSNESNNIDTSTPVKDIIDCNEINKLEKEEKLDEDGWVYILGHDQLKKRVLRAGNEDNVRPVKGQVAEVRCSGSLEDGTMVDNFEKLQITLGEEEFVLAFDLCLPLMYVGEVCELVTESRFAYGKLGRQPDIPSNSKITYEIELLSIRDQTPYSELPLDERIQLGDKKRLRGNNLYERGEYSKSLSEYMRALKVLEDATGVVDSNLLIETRIKCYNNLAAAQMKIEAWDAASNSCDEVLKHQPDNVKALFRKGKCMVSMGNTKDALNHLREAARLTPDSKAIVREINMLEKKYKQEEESEKALYQKMFGLDGNKLQGETNKSSNWWKLYMAGAMVAALISMTFISFRYSGE